MGSCDGSGQRVGLSLFGLGRAGNIHIKNVLADPRFELLYIVEEDIEKAENFIKCNFLKTKCLKFSDSEAAFSDIRVQALVVASATFTHKEIVLRAVTAKKSVFCEKPIAEDVEDIALCYNEAEKNGVSLLCGFNRRFDPGVNSVRDQVLSGSIGQVQVIKSTARDSPLPNIEFLKSSGGLLHDCASHDIDMLCWVIGEYPVSVFCQSHCFLQEIADINDVDTVVIVMKFPSGILATIDLSRFSAYGYDQRIEVHGNKGMAQNENRHPTGSLLWQKEGTLASPIDYSFMQRYREAYEIEMQHFYDVVTKKAEPLVNKEEVLSVCRIATACVESIKTGQRINIQYQ